MKNRTRIGEFVVGNNIVVNGKEYTISKIATSKSVQLTLYGELREVLDVIDISVNRLRTMLGMPQPTLHYKPVQEKLFEDVKPDELKWVKKYIDERLQIDSEDLTKIITSIKAAGIIRGFKYEVEVPPLSRMNYFRIFLVVDTRIDSVRAVRTELTYKSFSLSELLEKFSQAFALYNLSIKYFNDKYKIQESAPTAVRAYTVSNLIKSELSKYSPVCEIWENRGKLNVKVSFDKKFLEGNVLRHKFTSLQPRLSAIKAMVKQFKRRLEESVK